MSLSLVLRAASYFRLVPFHNIVQSIFITAWVGHLGLYSWVVIFWDFSFQNIPKSAQGEGNLQQKANTQPISFLGFM